MEKEVSRDNIEAGQIIMEESESGSRNLSGYMGLFIFAVAISMSIFQIYTGFAGELAGSKQLSIHLTFYVLPIFRQEKNHQRTEFHFQISSWEFLQQDAPSTFLQTITM